MTKRHDNRELTDLAHIGPLAPPALRLRIDRLYAEAAKRPRARLGWRLAAGATTASVAAVLLGLAVALPGGGPSTDAVAAIVHRPAVSHSVAASQTPGLLARSFQGVRFPDLNGEFGWRAAGARSDVVEGRRVDTVFYLHRGHRISYSVVSGDLLSPPAGAQVVKRSGITVHLSRDKQGHAVATFQRHGRTCVIAGHVLHASTLVKLAAWRAGGRLGA